MLDCWAAHKDMMNIISVRKREKEREGQGGKMTDLSASVPESRIRAGRLSVEKTSNPSPRAVRCGRMSSFLPGGEVSDARIEAYVVRKARNWDSIRHLPITRGKQSCQCTIDGSTRYKKRDRNT